MTMSVKLKVMLSSDVMQTKLYEKYTLALLAKVFCKSYIECSLLIAEQVGTWDCQFVFQILGNTVSRHPEVLLAQVCLLRLPLLLVLEKDEACSVHVCCCCLLQMKAWQRNPVPMSLLRQSGPIKKKKIAGIPRNVRCKGAYKHRSQESQQS